MSVEAFSWALSVPVGGNAKVVLLGLANHAHPDGTEAYPTYDTLAKYANCDRSTAKRNARKLEDEGWIQRDGTGQYGQMKWRLAMGAPFRGGGKMPPGSSEPEGGGISDQEGGAPVTPEPSLEPSKEPNSDARTSASTDDLTLQKIFRYWQEKCGHPQAKFTRERREKVKARLREGYTPTQICHGILGAAAKPTIGDDGRVYDDLELICRYGSKLESFISRYQPAEAKAKRKGKTQTAFENIERRQREQQG